MTELPLCKCQNLVEHDASVLKSCDEFNIERYTKLMQDEDEDEEEKKEYRESKHCFYNDYAQACEDIKNQEIIFASKYVLVHRENHDNAQCQSHTNCGCRYYMPRHFTLYSLVQRHLCTPFIQDNKAGFNWVKGCSLRNDSSRSTTWKEPLSIMGMSRLRYLTETYCERQFFTSRNEVLEAFDFYLSHTNVTVDQDKSVLEHAYPTLPKPLQEDLFSFLIYYSFEDYVMWGDRPYIDQRLIDLENNYFYYKVSCKHLRRLGHVLTHKDKQLLFAQLPITIWSP